MLTTVPMRLGKTSEAVNQQFIIHNYCLAIFAGKVTISGYKVTISAGCDPKHQKTSKNATISVISVIAKESLPRSLAVIGSLLPLQGERGSGRAECEGSAGPFWIPEDTGGLVVVILSDFVLGQLCQLVSLG